MWMLDGWYMDGVNAFFKAGRPQKDTARTPKAGRVKGLGNGAAKA
jgi:hypothetical protein